MNSFSSGTRLRDMIRAIRACKTAAEERAVVRKECASIRASVSDNDNDYRHRNLAKLMFIHMLGYPTHFGQMECLKLIAAPGFPEKRIGYLGLLLVLDERQEVLMLVTNSLKQDLNHTNQYIVGLALCALGNICSAEMARDLAPEAALCSIKIVKKVPDLVENFVNPVVSLLKEKHHGVLLTAIQLCTDLCNLNEEALEFFRKKCTEVLVKVLKDVVNNPYAPEYDVSGIADPFLHIRLLRLLPVLGHGDANASDSMNDILAQVATKTESNKNAGNAILYECVETIMSIEDSSGLCVLAINILGRFLSNRDNNIRYVALNMLMKAISVDDQAVQRHRATILECVKDSDASIRKRALELVYLLVNETNVKPLTKELIDYLHVSFPLIRFGTLIRCSWFFLRLGRTFVMELMIVAGKVVPILQLEHGVPVVTVYAGSFMTSLDMGAFSISIIKAEQAILQCLDVAAKAPHWPIGVDALSARCSKDLELNLAKSLLSEMGQCTTAYPYNQLFGALVLNNYERQDATLVSWNSIESHEDDPGPDELDEQLGESDEYFCRLDELDEQLDESVEGLISWLMGYLERLGTYGYDYAMVLQEIMARRRRDRTAPHL
uniref:DhaK domain-containing protein n=1 Tax=Lactuca sativa TaxID=4236 RepID=A0A9R1W996_LACSA|nr:hypothetical protein LSAT_V11C200061420 [Lactuca sativa]